MQDKKEQQLFFMRYALALGEMGRKSTPPNPWVGCVIVKDNEIVGQGFHAFAGGPHAEIVALKQAGSLARGASVYVTLEPCSHFGRTPPCTEALIQAGVGEVILPFEDPDQHVQGSGIQELRKHNISIVTGVAEEEARASLAPYLFHRKEKRPYCVLKAASSLDGKIAAKDGSSQWITGESARLDVHHLRAESQAILIGVQTALRDRPKLTVRLSEHHQQPLRVVLDSKGILPAEGPLFDGTAPTCIMTTDQCPKERMDEWKSNHAEVVVFDGEKVPLKGCLADLGDRGVLQLLVEGGSRVQSSFLKENWAQQFTLYLGNCVLGPEGIPSVLGLCPETIREAPRWRLHSMRRFDEDVRLDYRIDLKPAFPITSL